MTIRRIFANDDAVSPVIGVILMVAITVILAAVIAAFVLNLGTPTDPTPQVTFEFDYTDSDSGDAEGVLEITHQGGETIEADEVEIRGDLGTFSASSPAPAPGEPSLDTGTSNSVPITWSDYGSTEVSTGESLAIYVGSDYDVTVTYVSSEGETTSPLGNDEGPDA